MTQVCLALTFEIRQQVFYHPYFLGGFPSNEGNLPPVRRHARIRQVPVDLEVDARGLTPVQGDAPEPDVSSWRFHEEQAPPVRCPRDRRHIRHITWGEQVMDLSAAHRHHV